MALAAFSYDCGMLAYACLAGALILTAPQAQGQVVRPGPVRPVPGGFGMAAAAPPWHANGVLPARAEDLPRPAGVPIAPGVAYAEVLGERGWVEHRTERGSYILALRRGVDSSGRAVFVLDAIDAADPGRGTVAHVDFAVNKDARQAVFDGPLDSWTKSPPVLPQGIVSGDLSHGREHLWFGLSVVPEHQGRGLAGLLMDAASALARAEGAESLIIHSEEEARRGGEGEKVHRLVVKLSAPGAEPARRDKTLRFLAVMDLLRKGSAGRLPEPLKRAHTLIVPGLFGNHQPDAYGGNLRRIESLGLSGETLRLDTEGHAEEGRRAIEEAVRRAPGQVVLAGHSRGGVLVHDWYRTASAELKSKVSRVVLIQAPLSGTAYAEWVLGSWWRRLLIRYLGWKYRADLAATARLMTPRVRAAVLDALPPWAPADLAKVWVLRSVKPPGRSFYGRHAGLLKILGAPESDGIVPASAAGVAGAADILLQDVDHQNIVLQRPGWLKRWRGYSPHPDYDAGDITEALLRLLFR